MSAANPYSSIEKRTFESALVHLLETDYGLLGGRRILRLLAEDTQQLVEEFYPATTRAASGSLVWTCTADEGRKAEPGKRTEDYKPVTVLLPLVTSEDLSSPSGPPPVAQSSQAGHERDQRRLVRLVKAAAAQGGLLTLAEVSVILNRPYAVIQRYVHEWQEQTGELLPLKGYRMDQGSSPSHKGQIVRLSERGLEPPDIARETGHHLKSVERYLQDYERIKLLLKRGVAAEDIGPLIGRGKSVVLQYVQIAREFHPELFEPTKSTS